MGKRIYLTDAQVAIVGAALDKWKAWAWEDMTDAEIEDLALLDIKLYA